MHIGLFLSDLGGGGSQRRMLTLSRCFAGMGHSVDLAVSGLEGAFRSETPPEVRAFSVGGKLSRLAFVRRRRGLRLADATAGLVAYLRERRPDVLLSSSNPANLTAIAAAHRLAATECLRIPVVISVNVDLEAALAGRGVLHRNYLLGRLRGSYPKAAAAIAISSGVAGSLERVAGLSQERIAVIPNPVDCAAIRRRAALALEHPWVAPGAPPLILGVGKLKRQKDFETLIRAFARLRRTRPANLAILGEGERRGRLTALTENLGVLDCVALPGFAANPHAWMSRAAVFVLASRWEGFSNALAEAMAVGCPVVSTDCPSGPAELLEGGLLGPLVGVGDDREMAEAMARALEDPCNPAQLRRKAESFSVERAANRYLAVLEDAAASSRLRTAFAGVSA